MLDSLIQKKKKKLGMKVVSFEKKIQGGEGGGGRIPFVF